MEDITYLEKPYVYKTNNRNVLNQAKEDARGEYIGQICVGKGRITIFTKEAAKKYSKITGYI
ncbi:MAG: hypothetical protein J7K26_04010 [Candidatus Aenigmarchaeota archaeon]|nr:hypothetical protein [Candidatus Aenigmarchaeota archaeon]